MALTFEASARHRLLSTTILLLVQKRFHTMEISFKGKRVLVTGAGQGIGNGIAKRLVECGGDVVALDRDSTLLDKLTAEIPGVQTVVVDLLNWDATRKALEEVGSVDCLVNNAGVAILEPFLEVTPEAFDKSFNVNVRAVINVGQVVAKRMIQDGKKGKIVNISSVAAKTALKDHVVYCATKSAVDAITRVMALELGPHKIRVNAVNPTVVMTELGRRIWGEPSKGDALKARIPLGRFAEIADVVDAVLFLLSDKAEMIHGTTLPVEGGYLV